MKYIKPFTEALINEAISKNLKDNYSKIACSLIKSNNYLTQRKLFNLFAKELSKSLVAEEINLNENLINTLGKSVFIQGIVATLISGTVFIYNSQFIAILKFPLENTYKNLQP